MNERNRLGRLAKLRALRAERSRRRLEAALREEAQDEMGATAAADRLETAEGRAASYVASRFAQTDRSHDPAQFMAALTHGVQSLRAEARTLRFDAALQRRRLVSAAQRRAAAAAEYSVDEARRAQIERAEALADRRFRNLREDAEEQAHQDIRGAGHRNGIG